jgi:uncharacterized integral membrane protein
MRIIKWIIIVSFIALASVFSALNSQPVEINYFTGKQSLPLAFLLFLAMFVGVIFASVFLAPQVLIFKHRIKQLRSKLNHFEHPTGLSSET